MPSNLLEIFSYYIYPALLVLLFFGLTIFVHELGHFLVAKRRKMVERLTARLVRELLRIGAESARAGRSGTARYLRTINRNRIAAIQASLVALT